jgi:hypothetical protein
VPQDRLLDGRELGPRVQPQLAAQQLPRPAQLRERLGLPPRQVQRPRQQHPPALAQRLLRHQRRRRRDIRGDAQLGGDELLLRAAAQLLQPGGLDPAVRPRLQIRQRRAPPQLERLAQHDRRAVRLTGREQ